jgi:hypothetical protein
MALFSLDHSHRCLYSPAMRLLPDDLPLPRRSLRRSLPALAATCHQTLFNKSSPAPLLVSPLPRLHREI